MATGFESLLVNGAVGWHTGNGRLTYSYLGSSLPVYYDAVDTDSDGVAEFWMVSDSTNPAKVVQVSATAPVAFSVDQRHMMELAIQAWNEVARVNLVPGTVSSASEVPVGTPVTGDGLMVAGLGGTGSYGERQLPRSDDGSASYDFSAVFENGFNFFGTQLAANAVYVNNNGSISFNQAISSFSPETISSGSTPLIAAFWADVDTRIDEDPATPNSGRVHIDVDASQDVVSITWDRVGYYNTQADRTNSFQIQLYDRGAGDFDIVYRYQNINWTAGASSDVHARAGFSAGNGTDFFELSQSGNASAMADLENTRGNTGVEGLWVFKVRNGSLVGDLAFGSSTFLNSSGNPITSSTADYGFAYLPKGYALGDASLGGDVWINTGVPDQNVNEYGHTSYQTMLHELGHALGLEHPGGTNNAVSSNQWTVMSLVKHPSVASLPDTTAGYPLTPMIWDIQAIQKLYGVNTETRNTATTYFGAGSGDTELAYQFAVDQMTVRGRAAILTIWDAGGVDLIDASAITTASTIDLRPGTFSTIGATANNVAMSAAVSVGGRVINLIENATGGVGNDRITGNQAANVLTGGVGNDVLTGGLGNDTLNGGVGSDTFNGGDGVDTAVFTGNAALTVNLGLTVRQNTGQGSDLLQSIENLTTGNGHDKLTGSAVANKLQGMGGNDNLLGLAGDDSLLGGGGNDTLNGGLGADTLEGGLGNDVLLGGTGGDELWGGAGADSFRFLTVQDAGLGATSDVIWDFVSGLDTIDLSTIDANSLTAGVNDAFNFLLGGVFSGVAGQLTYSTTSGVLAGDVNGDSVADFQLTLMGNPALVAADLLV